MAIHVFFVVVGQERKGNNALERRGKQERRQHEHLIAENSRSTWFWKLNKQRHQENDQ